MIRSGDTEGLARELFEDKAFPDIDTARQSVLMASKLMSLEGFLPEEAIEAWQAAIDGEKALQKSRQARYGFHQRIFEFGNLEKERAELAKKIAMLRARIDAIRQEAARLKGYVENTAFENYADIAECARSYAQLYGLDLFEKAITAGIPKFGQRLAEVDARLAALKSPDLAASSSKPD